MDVDVDGCSITSYYVYNQYNPLGFNKSWLKGFLLIKLLRFLMLHMGNCLINPVCKNLFLAKTSEQIKRFPLLKNHLQWHVTFTKTNRPAHSPVSYHLPCPKSFVGIPKVGSHTHIPSLADSLSSSYL